MKLILNNISLGAACTVMGFFQEKQFIEFISIVTDRLVMPSELIRVPQLRALGPPSKMTNQILCIE